MRRPIIAANWKMHMTPAETLKFAQQFLALFQHGEAREVVICPPFTALAEAVRAFQNSDIKIGGQNTYWQETGPFTGEISPTMLKDLGCSHVIVGHSERRQLFGERDMDINLKLKAAISNSLTPIFCLGETLTERQDGKMATVCSYQLKQGLKGIEKKDLAKIVIAYEPIWAIGTGHTATPDDAQTAIAYIRGELMLDFGPVANEVRILYGGSVKPENIEGLMAQGDIDGALVGGASLDPQSFTKICSFGAPR